MEKEALGVSIQHVGLCVHKDIIDVSNELTGISRLMLQRALLRWIELDLQMKRCDERIEAHATRDGRFDPNHVPEVPTPHCALSQWPGL